MKLFNTHTRQTFHYDYVEPVSGAKTKFVLLPLKAKELPDEVAKELMQKFPKHFTADTEAMDARANSKKEIADRDQVIADLTKKVLEAEARADKAEAALELLADDKEAELAQAEDPTGIIGTGEEAPETAKPAAKAAEVKRKPGRPAKSVSVEV